jgi:hypothetical protein
MGSEGDSPNQVFAEPKKQEKGNGIVMRGHLEAKRSGRLSEGKFK